MQTTESVNLDFETLGDETLTRMRDEATAFCSSMKSSVTPYWLCLLGNSGTGKTHLARVINQFFKQTLWRTNDERNRSRLGGFHDWQKTVDKLKDGRYGLIDGLIEDWFAVIDDVGAEHDPSKFGVSSLLKVLNGRERKWTVVTSNLTLSEMGRSLDVRIASRLIRNNSRVIEIKCKDYNLR